VAVAGWILDKSAATRVGDLQYAAQVEAIREPLYLCPVGELEQLYSARSGTSIPASFSTLSA